MTTVYGILTRERFWESAGYHVLEASRAATASRDWRRDTLDRPTGHRCSDAGFERPRIGRALDADSRLAESIVHLRLRQRRLFATKRCPSIATHLLEKPFTARAQLLHFVRATLDGVDPHDVNREGMTASDRSSHRRTEHSGAAASRSRRARSHSPYCRRSSSSVILFPGGRRPNTRRRIACPIFPPPAAMTTYCRPLDGIRRRCRVPSRRQSSTSQMKLARAVYRKRGTPRPWSPR